MSPNDTVVSQKNAEKDISMTIGISQAILEQLKEFCDQSAELEQSFAIRNWTKQVESFLETALGPDSVKEFVGLENPDEWQEFSMRIGHLQGIIAKGLAVSVQKTEHSVDVTSSVQQSSPVMTSNSNKVFVVHGHDNEAKEMTARFLEKIGLKPIILHEQPSSGRTIIEKFEMYSDDVAFAIILLTPDDVGGTKGDSSNQSPRARQNVILELGYFMGRLGRTRVCALHKEGVELPSDYQGVVYIPMDSAGAWKAKVAQELSQSKLSIDLNGLVGG